MESEYEARIMAIEAWVNAEKEAAISKMLASEAFYEVANNTMQILGGRVVRIVS
jgi:alkylation response protein AidB-like acyl-CoA dehydrogenase